ncbi:hypothetical protein [Methanoculleus chikugoensis]|uniref:hypothetical protein n=1 Tax=Methanoculleus chikugoensis TaxID=118126 RepID=UPI001FB26376|nr:hypothetical protein [Methanoculleus chikugoensis]
MQRRSQHSRGRTSVTPPADVREAIALALPHRMRKRPFEEPDIDPGVLDDLIPDSDDPDPSDDETESPPQEQDESDESHPPPPSGRGGRRETHGIGSPVNTAPIHDDIPPRSHPQKDRTGGSPYPNSNRGPPGAEDEYCSGS